MNHIKTWLCQHLMGHLPGPVASSGNVICLRCDLPLVRVSTYRSRPSSFDPFLGYRLAETVDRVIASRGVRPGTAAAEAPAPEAILEGSTQRQGPVSEWVIGEDESFVWWRPVMWFKSGSLIGAPAQTAESWTSTERLSADSPIPASDSSR